MTITTKYNIGDTVWFMEDNKAHAAEVKSIELFIVQSKLHEIYSISHPSGKDSKLHVDYLFPSKQELLASL